MADEVSLSVKQEAYLDWLCTVPSERTPPSKRAFSEEHHCTTQTLRNWEKNKAFRDEWSKRVDQIQGSPEKTYSLLESLYSKAMNGDMRAADLYLRATNRMAPPTVKVETEHKLADLSDQELDSLIAASATREREARTPFLSNTQGGL